MYKQLKARSNQFSAKIISILRTSYYRPRGGNGERGNGGCWGGDHMVLRGSGRGISRRQQSISGERERGMLGGSHGIKGEQKGAQSSPTEYKWRTLEN